MYASNRRCKHKDCEAMVPFRSKESGYCDGKVSHWNEAEVSWERPRCECGADSMKSASNPHPRHSFWCPVYDYENG